jgi:hypothetical protein
VKREHLPLVDHRAERGTDGVGELLRIGAEGNVDIGLVEEGGGKLRDLQL